MKALPALALAGAILMTGCGSSDDDATAVCVDKDGTRVPDSECSSGSDGGMNDFVWFYLLSSMNQPRYGAQVVHDPYYSNPKTNRYAGFTAPKKVTVARGVPSGGGKVQVKGSVAKPSVNKAPKPANQQYNKPANRPYNPPRPPAPRPPAPRPR